MLLVQHLRENYDQVLLGLKKRNFSNAAAVLEQVLALDDLRKTSQTQRDQIQAEANTISKEIGGLMKAGKMEEATAVRDRSAVLKAQIKELEDQHEQAEESLKALLYTLPNVPHASVPVCSSTPDCSRALLAVPFLAAPTSPRSMCRGARASASRSTTASSVKRPAAAISAWASGLCAVLI